MAQRLVSVDEKYVFPAPLEARLDRKSLQRGDLSGSTFDVFDLKTNEQQGRWRVTSSAVRNLPIPALGYVDMSRNSGDGRVTLIFTRSTPGPLVQYSTVLSGGAWGGWMPHGWYRGLVAAGVDFHTIRDVGVYGIQFANHPNQPAPVIGSLEVLPSSGHVLQRFTENASPHNVWTSSFNGATWSKPIRSGVADEAPPLISVNGFSLPTRGALKAYPVTITSRVSSQIMSSMSKDRLRGWNVGSASVSETRNDGATWTQLNDKDGANPFAGSQVESVRQLDNGELLITNTRGSTGRREVWVSQNLDNPTSRTFTRTLEARAPYIKFTSAWSQSDYGSIVLLNEYGPKTPTWSGQPVIAGENARYTYLSVDHGKTWATVFDLNDYLTNTQGRTSMDGQHLHGVAWDEYWDRIWVSYGDNLGGNGSNGIVYSDDLGATWKTAHYFSGASAPHQIVGIQPMPKCVLFFGDMGPDVIRIDRNEGREKVGGYATPVAFNSSAEGMHLCQGFSRAKRAGDDAPTLAAWSSEGAVGPSFAIATLDGYAFTEIWRDTVNNPSGFGSRSIVGPTARGKVIIASNDQKVSGMWSQVTANAPGY